MHCEKAINEFVILFVMFCLVDNEANHGMLILRYLSLLKDVTNYVLYCETT